MAINDSLVWHLVHDPVNTTKSLKKKKSLRLQAVIYNLLVWHLVHDLERNLENKLPEDGRPKRSPC